MQYRIYLTTTCTTSAGGRELLSHPLASLAWGEEDEGGDISNILMAEIAADDLASKAVVSVTITGEAPPAPPSPPADGAGAQVCSSYHVV